MEAGGGSGEVELLGDGGEGSQQARLYVVRHVRQLTTQVRQWPVIRCWTATGGRGESGPMPHSPSSPTPLLAVSGATLVVLSTAPAPRPRTGPLTRLARALASRRPAPRPAA
ncbi:hypothetical protein GCM10009544_65810 [Streptomyces stramineus]|uniref:Uncharacterized protein n=1 Tax=Streptomyces stramineus TaxID=173861 RepID=A0ABP3LBG5_9ACTN